MLITKNLNIKFSQPHCLSVIKKKQNLHNCIISLCFAKKAQPIRPFQPLWLVLLSSASLCLLFLLFKRSTERCSHATPHLCVQQGSQEHHSCAQPVPHSKRVLKIEDGEDEAEELSECDHQSDGQRCALCGEDEDTADANISEGRMSKPKQRG